MAGIGDGEVLHIGDLADKAGVSADTVRYYERLGLLGSPARTAGGYRVYTEADLGRLLFIRRAKLLGLSLDEIRGLLGVAQEGECRPLRREVAELLRRKIGECEERLAELSAFKSSLEERYRLALEHEGEPTCGCASFPATCACLPVGVDELVSPSAKTLLPDRRDRLRGSPGSAADAGS